MTDLYTEDDLRAALLDLSADAPAVRDVLPQPISASRGRIRWLAPLAVAVLVLAVAVTVAVSRYTPHHAPTTGRPDQLTGRSWTLVRVGDRSVRGPVLRIEPNGRFTQNTISCDSLVGRAVITNDGLDVTRVHRSAGKCDVGPAPSAGRAVASRALQRELTGQLSWSVRGGRLTLSKLGEPPLVYVRTAGSPARTQTFTYRGVGVVVPRHWVKNAQHCGSPTRDTVLYPIPTLACIARRTPGVSAVQFAPYSPRDLIHDPQADAATVPIDGVEAAELTSRTDATEIELDIPSRRVSVLISSPSRGESFDLERAVYLVEP